ncbi:ABC transporter permease [Ekhidna sp.]
MRNSDKISPPGWPVSMVRWLIHREFLEEIEGDLEERFRDNVDAFGSTKARLFYVFDTVKLLRPALMKKGKHHRSYNQFDMFKHNIIISLRNYKRYKSTFLINLIGLTCGLASALLIFLWVNDELNMDQFNEADSYRHHQVLVNSDIPSGVITSELTPTPLPEAMEKELPEVAYAFPVLEHPYYQGVLSFDNEYVRAFPQFVGDGYLNVFECDFMAGDKQQAFADKNNIVISARLADVLFGNTNDAIGKTVQFKGQHFFDGSYIVSGVFDKRTNASFTYDFLFSFDQFLAGRPEVNNWTNGGTQTHLVLHKDVDLVAFNEKIRDFLKTKLKHTRQTLLTQPYADKYLYGQYESGHPVPGRLIYLRIFSLIALFILLIACINYMNLSTAQASRRIKEIGVKKAMGVQRKELMYQYFGESIIISFLSLIIAIGVVLLLLSSFNEVTGKELSAVDIFSSGIPVLSIAFFTGFISGIYPGLYLSNFNPVPALKGKIQSGMGGLWVRKGLVVFQFTISVALVVSMVVIYMQIQFVNKVNLGYDQEQLISFRLEGKMSSEFGTFMNEAKNIPGIKEVSYMWGNLGRRLSGGSNVQWKDQDPADRSVEFHFIEGGYEMAKMMGVELIEGRFLSTDFPSDSSAIVINETTAKLMGHEDPLGQKLWRGEMLTIVGVVKDFHFQGMHERIQPFYFTISSKGENFIVKIESENRIETISRLEELYASFNPGYPFDFRFIDDNYQKLYEEEERIATLSKYFSFIAITISCLGLLALTAFHSQTRFKEIAIRKVLGSSSLQIAQLLSRDFIALVIIAILIALPLGYYLMKIWLDGFAYRIALRPIYFVFAGFLILFVAWVTIISQTAKSAKVDVNEALKVE